MTGTDHAMCFHAEVKEAIRDRDPRLARAQELSERAQAAVRAIRDIPGMSLHEMLTGAILLAMREAVAQDEEGHRQAQAMAWDTAREQAAKALETQAIALRKMQAPR